MEIKHVWNHQPDMFLRWKITWPPQTRDPKIHSANMWLTRQPLWLQSSHSHQRPCKMLHLMGQKSKLVDEATKHVCYSQCEILDLRSYMGTPRILMYYITYIIYNHIYYIIYSITFIFIMCKRIDNLWKRDPTSKTRTNGNTPHKQQTVHSLEQISCSKFLIYVHLYSIYHLWHPKNCCYPLVN
jgi:hypothetical protein